MPTQWKFGKLNINILVLAIAYKGAAIPIFWTFLEKQGNSNTGERIELMNRFLKTFGKERVACLTADREFIGQKWIQFLKDQGISFRIRIRNNTKTFNSRGNRELHVSSLFRGLQVGETLILNKKRTIWNHSLHVMGLRTKDEYLILITDQAPETALSDYKKRWEIETLFAALKSRGFDLEKTHLNQVERIDKMLALISIAFAWCYRIGQWTHQQKALKTKKHGRLEKSVFRLGLDTLRNILLNLNSKTGQFQWAVNLLNFQFK